MRCGKISYRRAGHTWQYGASALHAGYLRLQTHTQYMYYLLISTATMVALRCLNIRSKVPVLLNLKIVRTIDVIVEYCSIVSVTIIITSYRDSTPSDIYSENRLCWFELLNILLIPPHNTCTPQQFYNSVLLHVTGECDVNETAKPF